MVDCMEEYCWVVFVVFEFWDEMMFCVVFFWNWLIVERVGVVVYRVFIGCRFCLGLLLLCSLFVRLEVMMVGWVCSFC